MTVRVRVGPSPTGDPHVGTAYIALFNRAFARKVGGEFVLRIEDTDRERYVEESERRIFESLNWLGLTWDEGPDVGGPRGPYRQSERTDIYREQCGHLVDSGTAYPCFCTSEELAAMRERQKANKETPRYDRRCRGLDPAEAKKRMDAGEPYVIRLAVPIDGETVWHDKLRGDLTFQNSTLDDQVLLKSDGFPTYHLANVVDDHLMGITHVIRAEEWITSTPKHVLLYKAFGWDVPEFVHMPLLRSPGGAKISKRKNPTSLEFYKSEGFLPEVMVNFLALCGYSMPENREIFTFEEMVELFDWKRVNLGGPVFNVEKLTWLNGEYIRAMSVEDLAERLVDFGIVPGNTVDDKLLAIVPLIQERVKILKDFPEWAGFFYADSLDYPAEELIPKNREATETKAQLEKIREVLAGADEWKAEPLEAAMKEYVGSTDWKPRDLFMPLRIAVTGAKASPPLFESMEILGRDECVKRVDEAAGRL